MLRSRAIFYSEGWCTRSEAGASSHKWEAYRWLQKGPDARRE